jgi:tRNA threonylcarbamoyladenosine biosynthesis protein TsaB
VIVLALDTALAATSAAVLDGDRVLAVRCEPMERGHQERLAGLVRDAMAEACVAFDGLDRIGVTVGPGSFTGLRVGLAFAKGLSIALGAPCVGIGSLRAMAASVAAPGLIAAVMDARRGQLYWQLFEDDAALGDPEALAVEEVQERLDGLGDRSAVTLVGSGAALLTPDPRWTVDPRRFPDPVAVARLTLQADEPIARPEPLYLRPPDAKTIVERAAL